MASKFALETSAQAWCQPSTSGLVMIPELAEAFAEIIDEIRNQAQADIDELKTKLERK